MSDIAVFSAVTHTHVIQLFYGNYCVMIVVVGD